MADRFTRLVATMLARRCGLTARTLRHFDALLGYVRQAIDSLKQKPH